MPIPVHIHYTFIMAAKLMISFSITHIQKDNHFNIYISVFICCITKLINDTRNCMMPLVFNFLNNLIMMQFITTGYKRNALLRYQTQSVRVLVNLKLGL